ncbi:PCNA-interacting partner [Aplysia californica]|uniref:PCNA-interacting partner n=1 Tax=Aplysia californica TaxID=6500 RepID=A0ABM0K087_APLCA|nr:PCNA-interacting partner [Aplysia californica]
MVSDLESKSCLTYFVVKLCRQGGLFPNDRTTLLTEADELQILQFCLSKRQEEDGSTPKPRQREAIDLQQKMNEAICRDIEEKIQKALKLRTKAQIDGQCKEQSLVSDDTILKSVEQDGREPDLREEASKSAPLPETAADSDTSPTSDSNRSPGSSQDTGDFDEMAKIKETVTAFQKTSNHISVMDIYRIFVSELCKEDTDLGKEIQNRKENFAKLVPDLDHHCAMQKEVIQLLHLMADVNSECTPSTEGLSSENSVLDVTELEGAPPPCSGSSDNLVLPSSQESSASSRPEPLMSPKTPSCQGRRAAELRQSSNASTPSTPFSQTERLELCRVFIHDVLRSYLHLLVNSRSQVALARVFNIPDRGLDHQAFTHLKHEAAKTGLSMYQEVSSFMLRLRLGGKGYAPPTDNPLMAHVKGLGALLEFTQKLQTTVEEDPSPGSACRRVVNIIKNNLVLCKSGRFPRTAVEPVAQEVHQSLAALVEEAKSSVSGSPDRSVSSGGSVLGRRCLNIIRSYLDTSALTSSRLSGQLMRDVRFSSQTPTRFPCLLTQFRSPCLLEEEDETAEQEKEIQETDGKGKSKISDSNVQFVSSALYVDAGSDLGLLMSQRTMSSVEVLPSKTIVQPREGSDFDVGMEKSKRGPNKAAALQTVDVKDRVGKGQERKGKRCPETRSEKENITKEKSGVGPSKPKQQRGGRKAQASVGELMDSPKSSKKNNQIGAGKKKVDKSCRRRLLPQVKGQAKITGFFRT